MPTPSSRLRAARLARGLTQAQAAALVGASPPAYRDVELGRRKVSLDLIHHYAVALGADPHAIDARLASVAPKCSP